MTKLCAYCQLPMEVTDRTWWKRYCSKQCCNAYHALERRKAVEQYRLTKRTVQNRSTQ